MKFIAAEVIVVILFIAGLFISNFISAGRKTETIARLLLQFLIACMLAVPFSWAIQVLVA